MCIRDRAQLGPIAVLVNNAGIVRDGLAMRMSSEDFRAVLDVNLTGAFHMIRACLPLFIRRRAGSIVKMCIRDRATLRSLRYSPMRSMEKPRERKSRMMVRR